MASPQAEAVHDALREFHEAIASSDRQPSLEEQRDAMAAMAAMTTEPEGVTLRDTYAGGVRAFWHTPDGADTDRVLLYLHGGGYVMGSPRSHQHLVSHLALALGCPALNLDYRLAPEHPHPAAVEDTVAAYRWLLDRGHAPGHLAIAGDSAGGGLTLATLVALRDAGLPQPAGAAPISPWTDMEGTGESMTSRADLDLLVGRDGLKIMADHFLAGSDPRHPHASPLHADLAGLAPIYIQVGDHETLLDDSTRFAARAEAAGLDVRIDVFPEMQHVFQFSAGNVPEADEALARIAAWLRPRLGLG
jgi:monoterpene epsilon-lactone hydrolase